MRRATLAAVLIAAATLTGACSSSDADQRVGASPASEQSGLVPTSQQFDRPFPIGAENWDATVTLSNLRIVPSSMYSDIVIAVDVRAVQSAGQPVLGPEDFSAYDPAGARFEQIENPAGVIDDPLVPSVMATAGEQIQGTVAWTVPRGTRIGRIEMTSPRTIGSITVTRQPSDPTDS